MITLDVLYAHIRHKTQLERYLRRQMEKQLEKQKNYSKINETHTIPISKTRSN